jgi:hypothetical protein
MIIIYVERGVGGCTFFVSVECDGADLVCAQSNFLAIWTARRTPAFSRWEVDVRCM